MPAGICQHTPFQGFQKHVNATGTLLADVIGASVWECLGKCLPYRTVFVTQFDGAAVLLGLTDPQIYSSALDDKL